jgi:hypothetical protein
MNYKIFLLLTIFYSCSSKKQIDNDLNLSIQQKTDFVCPEGGNCMIEILTGKSFSVKNFNNALTYQLMDDATKTTIHFQYTRKLDESIFDGGYREELFFELDNKDQQVSLIDEQLQNLKFVYGRHTNSRNKNGLFFVYNGNLKLYSKNGKISFSIDYDMGDIPQKIKKINVIDNKLYFK